MSLEFQDYYETLGVDRKATQKEISTSFRKLARELHPDVNKAPDAEDKFKQLNEAYEVLKDEEKRERYDALGADYKNGQNFQPPPGWESMFGGGGSAFGGGGGAFGGGGFSSAGGGAQFSDADGQFSDFFNVLFGQSAGGAFGSGGGGAFGSGGARGRRQPMPARKGANYSASVKVTLEEVVNKASKRVSFQVVETPGAAPQSKSYDIKIPPGIKDGQTIRLSGQGQKVGGGGKDGDLLITIEFQKHSQFEVDGKKLRSDIQLSPWEAALGTKVEVQTLHGALNLSIPAGTQSGSQFRLKGKGLPLTKETFGDLFVKAHINVPKKLTKEEEELFTKLQTVSTFNPREIN